MSILKTENNRKWWGNATILFYMLVSFQLPNLVCFPSNPCFILQLTWFLIRIISLPHTTMCCFTWGARMKGAWGGVIWMAYNCYWLHERNYSDMLFNVKTRGQMPYPSPATGTTGGWGVETHGLFVSTISWPQFWTDCLPSPACEKWVCPFSLPRLDSNSRVLPGIPSLARHLQKLQTEKSVSFDSDSAYYNHPSWFYTTNPGVPPMDQIYRNSRQCCQVWCQW